MLVCRRRRQLLQLLFKRPSSSNPPKSPNAALIKLIKDCIEQEKSIPERNNWKIASYGRAINVIASLKEPLRTMQQAKKLRGIGVGLLNRLQPFLEDEPGPLLRPGRPKLMGDHDQLVQEFKQIPGIGTSRANVLIEAGCTSLKDLHRREFFDLLSPSMQVEATYFHDLKTPATRQEAEIVLQFVQNNISSKFDVELVGDYRRSASTFQEISIILHHDSHIFIPVPEAPDLDGGEKILKLRQRGRRERAFRVPYTNKGNALTSLLMKEIVMPLEDRGLPAALIRLGETRWRTVALIPEYEDPKREGASKWGSKFSRLEKIKLHKGVFRRVEFNLVARKSRGAALLFLTGDEEFTRDLRNRASHLSMQLNEFGLWQWERPPMDIDDDPSSKPSSDDTSASVPGFWKLLKSDTEEDIFEQLGMAYVAPEKRNFSFLFQTKQYDVKKVARASSRKNSSRSAKVIPENVDVKKRGRPRKLLEETRG